MHVSISVSHDWLSSESSLSAQNLTEEEKTALAEHLEKARMLVELVRKREKLKREQVRWTVC